MKLLGKDKTLLVRDWTTEAGLRARLVFTMCEFFCGYVAVPKEHPFHGNEAAYEDSGEYITDEVRKLEVHGGITWCDSNTPPDFEDEGLWWFGFDCRHSGDLKWGETDHGLYGGATFKDENYVIAECERLARQIADWTPSL